MSVGKLVRQGLPFSNVVATGIASAQISPGRTIEGIQLMMGGTFTYAMISLIRVRANGKTFFEGSGTEIDRINKFQGLNYPATVLPLMFTEVMGRDLVDQMMGAFDTSTGIANITIEVTIAGATSPTLSMFLIESAPQAESVSQVIKKLLRYPFSVSAGGQLNIQLPFGPVNGAVIQRIHIQHGVANNVTACVVKENGVVVHESTLASNTAFNQLYRSANQTNWYSVDMVADENVKNAMDTRTDRSLELVPTFGAADSGFVLVEYLDTLGNL